jgi:rod shape-determining protein MreD
MADAIFLRKLLWQTLFLLLCALVVLLHLLPLGRTAGSLPGPDFLVLLAFAWVIRRPDYVPVLLVAGIMLLADLLFLRPPGLWAAIVVLGHEFLRNREQALRDLPFLVEWGLVALLLLAMTVGEAAALLLVAVNQPRLGLTLFQLIVTILSYPVVVALTVFVFGLRRAAPGEVDELGRRL